jgi:hypothetical protein
VIGRPQARPFPLLPPAGVPATPFLASRVFTRLRSLTAATRLADPDADRLVRVPVRLDPAENARLVRVLSLSRS